MGKSERRETDDPTREESVRREEAERRRREIIKPHLKMKYARVFDPYDWIKFATSYMVNGFSDEQLFNLFNDNVPLTRDLKYWGEKFEGYVRVKRSNGDFEDDWKIETSIPFKPPQNSRDTYKISVRKSGTKDSRKYVPIKDFLKWNGVQPRRVGRVISEINRRLKEEKGVSALFKTISLNERGEIP